MSKKKLTKKKKKKLLALFATTTMTMNLAMAPLSVLAEQTEFLDTDSAVNVLEKNMDLPDETITKVVDSEKESTDVEEAAEEAVVETSGSTVVEKEAKDEQKTENEIKAETLTGSYEDGGTWTFNQENGLLVLSEGTLSASIGEDSWLKEIKKVDVLEIRVVDAVGAKDLSKLFYYYSNTKNITFEQFDTSNVTNMSSMFNSCTDLEEVDISGFDTSNVEDMSDMFAFPGYLAGQKNNLSKITLGNIDTSQVTNMSGMFYGCGRLTELDVSNFDTSQVANMSAMFSGCSNLIDLDVSNFDTSQVTSMSDMFGWCSRLTELDVSNFDTSQVTNMSYMFANCRDLTKLNLQNFDTNQVTHMNFMFFKDVGHKKITKLILGSQAKFTSAITLKNLSDNELWYGEHEGNLITSSNDLIDYHNDLNETNTYTIINKSEKSVMLSFDTVGGSEISPIEVNFGDVWVEPAAPIKEGYVFEGWYTDAEYTKKFDFGRAAVEPLTVYAKWAEEKEDTVFEVDTYHIGDYNITGRFSVPIVTAQLRIDGNISNKGGTFNQNDGTFYYYAGAGRIQIGQEVVLEGLDKSGNIVETVKIEPKVVEGMLSDVQHTLGSSKITGAYTGEMSKARLVVNGNIVSVGGTFKDGTFSYYVTPSQVKESDTVQLQGYDKEGKPVGNLMPITIQKQQGQLTEATYKLGQSTITGTYEGNVKKARLLVDGKQISWGGTFKEGIFSYYVAPGTIKADSTVELAVYGEGDILLSPENFAVTIQP